MWGNCGESLFYFLLTLIRIKSLPGLDRLRDGIWGGVIPPENEYEYEIAIMT